MSGMGPTCRLAVFGMTILLTASCSGNPQGEGQTIGLVLTDWQTALYETPDAKEECPRGLTPSTTANFAAQFKDEAERKAYIARYGVRPETPQIRGANGEDPAWFPQSAEDRLPFHAVEGKFAYGFNLDGTTDGAATARTCQHSKFSDPDTATPVDNQLYRLIGCTMGYRTSGYIHDLPPVEFVQDNQGRLLLEITGVDDRKNDPEVTVTLYKGKDALTKDANGHFIPNLSQRIDASMGERHVTRMKGRIVDGVLTTEPVDRAAIPKYQMSIIGDLILRGMRIRLKLTDQGAEGMIGGYADVQAWWNMFARHSMVVAMTDVSPPSYYRAIHQLADGYPDPRTKACTAISAAYQVKAVPAFIVHPDTP